MKLTNSKLKQLIREIAEESEWDVSKRTAFPRVVADLKRAKRGTRHSRRWPPR